MHGNHNSNRYVLDWKKLQPGDILLSRETLKLEDVKRDIRRLSDVCISKVIRLATGAYSHAMVYFAQSIIHAEKPGVYSKNPQRVSVAGKDDLLVLRCPNLSSSQLQGIEEYCRCRVGSLYDTKAALMVPLKKAKGRAVDGQQFCSRLVAKAYESVGIRLVDNPDYCAPSEFQKSEKLIIIGNELRLANERDKEILSSRDFVKENLDHTFSWLCKARDYALRENGAFIQTVEEAIQYLIGNPSADEVFARALEESGMLTDWEEERAEHQYRYNAMLLQQMVASGLCSFDDEIGGLERASDRFIKMLMAISSYLLVLPASKFLNTYREMYSHMIADCEEKAVVLATLVSLGLLSDSRPARIFANCTSVVP